MENVAVKSVTTDDRGNIMVVADLAGEVDHTIYLRPDAIANRMVGYELATEAEAIDAIMREHALRLSDLQPKSDERVDQLGGVDDRITVTTEKAAEMERDAVLAENADVIAAAVEAFTPKPPDAAETP